MKTIIVSSEIVAAIFLTIIYMGYYTTMKGDRMSSRHFRYCILSILAGLIVDALSYILDGRGENLFVGFLNYLSYAIVPVIIFFISLDLYYRIRESRSKFNRALILFNVGLCLFDILALTIGALTGKLFVIENGMHVLGLWNEYISLIPSLVSCILDLVLVIYNADVLGKRQTAVFALYFLLPVLVASVEIVVPGLQLGYVGLAVGISFFFNIIQAEINDEANLRSMMLHMQEHTINSMASLIESRDLETGEHVARTSRFVTTLAKCAREDGVYASSIDDKFIDMMREYAPLHDIGKIAVPDAILRKPGKLTSEEYDKMKEHALAGGIIVRDILEGITDEENISFAQDIAQYHHEWWDGRGYHKGLTGEDIPLSARVMAIADVYDALVSERVYKKAIPPEKAFEIIREESGTHFDPKLTEVFLRHKNEFI